MSCELWNIRCISSRAVTRRALPIEHWRLRPCFSTVPELVSEPHLFDPGEFPFERKQIPRFVVNIRSSRKTIEPLEATRLPWARGSRVNARATQYLAAHICCTQTQPTAVLVRENTRSIKPLALIEANQRSYSFRPISFQNVIVLEG
jgi:hypothetical protein